MELVIAAVVIFCFALALGVVCVIAKYCWLTFTWKILGITPRILDEEIVAKTVEACLESSIQRDLVAMVYSDIELTDEEQRQYRDHLNRFIRSNIEEYIARFMRR